MINQKDSKQVKMGSWFLKLLSRDMKTKTKYKTNKKSLKKQENKSNAKYNNYHGLLSHKWIDGRCRSLISYFMLTQVTSKLLPGLRVVKESSPNNTKADCIE